MLLISTYTIERLNDLLKEISPLENIAYDADHLYLLRFLEQFGQMTLNDILNDLEFTSSKPSELIQNLIKAKLVDIDPATSKMKASKKGSILIGIQKYNLKKLEKITLKGTYFLDSVIGEGTTSVTFKGKHTRTERPLAVKIFKPRIFTPEHAQSEIKIATQVNDHRAIAKINDFDSFEYKFNDEPVSLFFEVFDFVEGMTLDEFIESNQILNKEFYESFISDIGGGLEAMESKGLKHGDLHGKNILITQIADNLYAFKIIDFTGITSPLAFEYIAMQTDIQKFRLHAINLISRFVMKNSALSLERFLGPKLFNIYKNILNERYSSFREIMKDYKEPYIKPTPEEEGFPFGISRLEEFEDKVKMIRSFEPDLVLFDNLKKFGNTIISGPRGCGKSTYLEILSFNPEVIKRLIEDENEFERKKLFEDLKINYQKSFGIFIPCRQGEFKIFSPNIVDFDGRTPLFIKHIFILKFMTCTLNLISKASELNLFTTSNKLDDLIGFIKSKLSQSIYLIGEEKKSIMQQIATMFENEVNMCISILGEQKKYPALNKLFSEADLIKFYRILRRTQTELNLTKFYILLDDVTATNNISYEAQRILNSIVRSTNEVFCFKISTDKYYYDLSDEGGKQLQEIHDYIYLDLGNISMAMHKKVKEQSKYLERIINTRLIIGGHPADKSISDYLTTPDYEYSEMINLLASKNEKIRNAAKYAGWKLVWKLPTGSVRKLIELCDYLFHEGGIKKEFKEIPVDTQDFAIRDFSKKQLIMLRSTAGVLSKHATKEITGNPEEQIGIGEMLFIFARSFGQISQNYLREYQPKSEDKKRKYELIAIERNDSSPLSESANEILMLLIANSVLADEGLTFARSQIGLSSKYVINRMLCPAFETTFRSRYHLRLSKEKMEYILLHPSDFLFDGTEFLSSFHKGSNIEEKKASLRRYDIFAPKIGDSGKQSTILEFEADENKNVEDNS